MSTERRQDFLHPPAPNRRKETDLDENTTQPEADAGLDAARWYAWLREHGGDHDAIAERLAATPLPRQLVAQIAIRNVIGWQAAETLLERAGLTAPQRNAQPGLNPTAQQTEAQAWAHHQHQGLAETLVALAAQGANRSDAHPQSIIADIAGVTPPALWAAAHAVLNGPARAHGGDQFTQLMGPQSVFLAARPHTRQFIAGLGPAAHDRQSHGPALARVAERRGATLFREARGAQSPEVDDPAVTAALRRAGQGDSLAEDLRRDLERRLGSDFSRVRIHTDTLASDAARAVDAVAFTVGEDIFFSAGSFDPGSASGQKLLIHELTHVVQGYQGRVRSANAANRVSQPGDALEREADLVAQGQTLANRAVPAVKPAPTIHYAPDAAPTLHRKAKGANAKAPAKLPEASPAELQEALTWAAGADGPDAETVSDIRTAVGLDPKGQYDEATARAVFAKQATLKLTGKAKPDGKANPEFCEKVGVITAVQVKAALAWAAGSDGPGVQTVRALQENLQVKQTGVYDRETARAVFAKQRVVTADIHANGRALAKFCEKIGVIFVGSIGAATVSEEVAKRIVALYGDSDGVDVAVYTKFIIQDKLDADKKPVMKDGKPVKRNKGDEEFERKAIEFAKQRQTLAIIDGQLTIGVPNALVDGPSEFVSIVQGIHQGLVAAAQTLAASKAPQSGAAASLPKWTRIKNLSVFTHGLETGVAMDINAHTYRGNHAINKGNVRSFVTQVEGALAPNVDVQLYACSTGHIEGFDKKEIDKETGKERTVSAEAGLEPIQGEHQAADSFASHLAQELQSHGSPDATTYGHTTEAHATENHNARVFGKGAGGGPGGLHMFDVIYPETLIQFELALLIPGYEELPEKQKNGYHKRMRDSMFSHYMDCIGGEMARDNAVEARKNVKKDKKDKKDKKKEPGPPRFSMLVGMEMFRDPDHAREIILADWHQYWLTDPKRVKKILNPHTKGKEK